MRRREPLGGGCIGRIERLETSAGTFVLKCLPGAPAALFEAEAAGLAAIGQSGTPLVVPRVVTISPGASDAAAETMPPFLVIEYLAPGSRLPDYDERLGEGLAALHRTTADRFGFAGDTYCGAIRQPNDWADGWVEFFASSRLGYQLELAHRHGRISSRDRRLIEQLIGRLDRWLDEPAEGPALLHGDLWSGNAHVTCDGLPALLDPAVYFGHREAELGMMTLFGGFSARVFDAYHHAFPLDPGWRERNALYQLYHLLNHLNLFGEGYLASVMAIARRYV